jgi:hypothetical protein
MSLPNDCPDGMDCPNWEWCQEFIHSIEDPCPLENPHYDHNVPLDKIITDD